MRFRDDFRKEYKEAHPGNKDVKTVQIFGVLFNFIWCLMLGQFLNLCWTMKLRSQRRVVRSGNP